ncbi:MAG: hypothetical protein IAF02_13000 [Anaerolineae bacterium]|nr:hypothetical protein [Anaerolineae bacterium]
MTSGVPAPNWMLGASEIETLTQLLNDLPATDAPSLFDGLGYRGFVITLTAPERLIRVQDGYVVVEQNGSQKAYVDTDNQIETWLLTASKPHIEPQLYVFLEESIGK